jgi:hypothetical protein
MSRLGHSAVAMCIALSQIDLDADELYYWRINHLPPLPRVQRPHL